MPLPQKEKHCGDIKVCACDATTVDFSQILEGERMSQRRFALSDLLCEEMGFSFNAAA